MKTSILKTSILPALTFAVFSFACVQNARADSFKYTLASQQEWGNKRGFTLGLESNIDQIPGSIESVRLILGVADGKSWRFTEFKPQWQWDHAYKVKAVIDDKNAQLWVDGELVKESAGAFVPGNSLRVLFSGLTERDQTGKTDYQVRQSALKVSKGAETLEIPFRQSADWPKPLFLMEPQTPIRAPWTAQPGQPITLEATFELVHANVADYAPYIDKFGQSVHGDWRDKIRSDADLQKSVATEATRNATWGTEPNVDAFGGSKTAGWSEKPTGFFRVAKRDGFWWLISPDGNPLFYRGVDTVTGTFEATPITGREAIFAGLPPKTGPLAAAWRESKNVSSFGFSQANLIRKYGDNWENAAWQSAETRLRAWGFSGLGKWSGKGESTKLPVQPVLRRTGVPTLGRIPDIFDASVRAKFHDVLEKGIIANKDNPYILGWSVGNEHEEIILKTDIASMLKMDSTVPAKRALTDYAIKQIYGGDAAKLAKAWKIELNNQTAPADQIATAKAPQIPAGDIETMRRYYADNYYGFIYRTVKEIDPNHLYFGFWIGFGWWEDDEDWRLIARHTDVIGYDDYPMNYGGARFTNLAKQVDKPVMLGEFGFASWYDGMRGYGVYGSTFTPDDATAGGLYARLIRDAASDPYTIGVEWFQYRDQPVSGRTYQKNPAVTEGEHYAFGLVDIADQPKWDLIEPMRAANLSAVATRLQASQK